MNQDSVPQDNVFASCNKLILLTYWKENNFKEITSLLEDE